MMHDPTVDRTTDGTGSVAEMTLAEIKELHIKNHPDMTVPTLEEFIAVSKAYGCLPNIELKSSVKMESIPAFIQILKDTGIYHYCIVSAGYWTVPSFRAVDDTLPFAIIGQTAGAIAFTTIIERAKNYKNTIVELEHTGTITQEMIKDCHDHNIPIIIFSAQNSEHIKECFRNGADMVITDGVTILPVPA